ncbi:hypothetical protein HDU89_002373 [Geranomyces variabilis]|nr:hypothetical protein HDU89_002373 [Geranomyces variabilis]
MDVEVGERTLIALLGYTYLVNVQRGGYFFVCFVTSALGLVVVLMSLVRSFFEGHPRARALDGKQALIDGTERDAPNYAEVRLLPKEILPAAVAYFGKLQQEYGKDNEALRELALLHKEKVQGLQEQLGGRR